MTTTALTAIPAAATADDDLDFVVTVARSQSDLLAACAVRSAAYGRVNEVWGQAMKTPDAHDTRAGTLVLLVRSKATGEALGTARVQFSADAPLLIDGCAEFPPEVASATRAEVTRLAIKQGADARVRLALIKACYWHCMGRGVRFLVIGARKRGLIRIYRELGFEYLGGSETWVPLSYGGNQPYCMLVVELRRVAERWIGDGHRLLSFMKDTVHTEIELPTQTLEPLPLAA